MAVDIVGGTLVGYFSLSGAPLLDLSESAVRDYYKNLNQVSPSSLSAS